MARKISRNFIKYSEMPIIPWWHVDLLDRQDEPAWLNRISNDTFFKLYAQDNIITPRFVQWPWKSFEEAWNKEVAGNIDPNERSAILRLGPVQQLRMIFNDPKLSPAHKVILAEPLIGATVSAMFEKKFNTPNHVVEQALNKVIYKSLSGDAVTFLQTTLPNYMARRLFTITRECPIPEELLKRDPIINAYDRFHKELAYYGINRDAERTYGRDYVNYVIAKNSADVFKRLKRALQVRIEACLIPDDIDIHLNWLIPGYMWQYMRRRFPTIDDVKHHLYEIPALTRIAAQNAQRDLVDPELYKEFQANKNRPEVQSVIRAFDY